MNTPALGSTFEISLRILLLLNEAHGATLDEQQIGAVDFISVYAADFGLLDENLHGYSNYANEYRIAVQTVIKSFDNANTELMLREISRLTIQSLEGGQA